MTIPLERCLCCWSTTNWVLQQQIANQHQQQNHQRPAQEDQIMQLQAQLQNRIQSPLTRQTQLSPHQQVALSPSAASAHSAQSNIVATNIIATSNTSTPTTTDISAGITDVGSTTTTSTTTRRDKKKKSKRVRTTFTPEQLSRLEAEFVSQNYLVGEYRNYLARLLNLNECQVKVWFQNRRIKKRKQEKQERKEHQ